MIAFATSDGTDPPLLATWPMERINAWGDPPIVGYSRLRPKGEPYLRLQYTEGWEDLLF